MLVRLLYASRAVETLSAYYDAGFTTFDTADICE